MEEGESHFPSTTNTVAVYQMYLDWEKGARFVDMHKMMAEDEKVGRTGKVNSNIPLSKTCKNEM
jgi:hypothetical protein